MRKKKYVLDLAVETFGKQKQAVKAIEEMSELTKELSKDIIGEGDLLHIAEEMADVEIMLNQLKRIYHNQTEVKEWKEVKIQRLDSVVKKELRKRDDSDDNNV